MSAEAVRGALRPGVGRLKYLAVSAAIVVCIYLCLPVFILLPISLTKGPFLTWPPSLFSDRWFHALLTDPAWTGSLMESVKLAVPVTLVATALGSAAAIGTAHANRGKSLLRTLFIAPIILPVVAYALGVYDVASRVGLLSTLWPVLGGQLMLATPLVFVVVSAAAEGLDPSLSRAAASLGAGWRTVVWRIELPLLAGAIAAGAVFAFAYSFDETVVAYFLLPPGTTTLPVEILSSTRETASPIVAAASIVVIATAILTAALTLTAQAYLQRERT